MKLYAFRHLPWLAALLLGTTLGAHAAGQVNPRTLFAEMRAASGGSHWQNAEILDIQAKVKAAGLHGKRHMLVDLDDGRFVETWDLGPASHAEGYDGDSAWMRDEKGLVTVLDGAYRRRRAATRAYVMRQGWFDATDRAEMEYLGERDEDGHRYQVIRVTPLGGLPLQIWIDPASHLLASLRHIDENGQQQITRYSNYRRVDGIELPFHSSSGTPEQPDQEIVRVVHASVTAAATTEAFAKPALHIHDAHMLGGTTSATLPFDLYAGLIVVQVSINGADPRAFVLDSGGLNILTPAAAKSLGLTGSGNQTVTGAGPATASMSMASVDSMRLGDAVLDNQRFYILQLPLILTDRGRRQPLAGLIGYEVLRRFVTRIDYDHKRLTLTPPTHFNAANVGRAVPLYFDGRTPQVQAEVDGASGLFLLDSGNTGKLALNEQFLTTHAIHLGGDHRQGMVAGVGGARQTRDGEINALTLGGFRLPHLAADIVTAETGVLSAQGGLAGNIGSGVLQHFLVTFDYPRQRMYLQPGARFGHVDTRGIGTGLGLTRLDHHTLGVIAVATDSAAARAGVKKGDRICAIDGIPVSELGLDQLRTHLEGAAGSAMTVTLMRDNHGKQTLRLLRDR